MDRLPSLVISRMRCTFGTQVMDLVELAQDCLEMRFDGFTEWRKPERRSAIEQGASEFVFQSPNCS
jgi:uncharacterized protein YaiE (UPF0345 family)